VSGPRPAGGTPGAARAARAQRRTRRRRRRVGRRTVIAALLVAVSGVGLVAFQRRHERTHDLSVIGNGVPTVVQIHDPSCPKCRRLRANASAAARRLDGALQFRVADVTTLEGRRLQLAHDVPHVTLLLFDGDGALWRVVRGVQDVDFLRRTFLAHIERQPGGRSN